MTMELEDLRHEKELQREDIQKLQGEVHTLRTEIQVRRCKGQKGLMVVYGYNVYSCDSAD